MILDYFQVLYNFYLDNNKINTNNTTNIKKISKIQFWHKSANEKNSNFEKKNLIRFK